MNPTLKSLKKAILSSIRSFLLEYGSATKVELSDRLDISFPTISKFLAEMEKEGEIISIGLDESSGGRRAKRYKYNPDYMLGLAIFLERTETNYTIFNCAGEVKKQGKEPSVLTDDGKNSLIKLIEKVLSTNPLKISSIAIGVPGSVENGRIFYIPGYEHFQNFNLKGYIEESFSIPVVVENDMNAAALGFHHRKGVQDHQSLVYLYFGQNGPGAGLIINGDVVRGSTFFAGEVSFVPQYDGENFGQALERESRCNKDIQIDAVSRLVSTFVAILNPHTIIFCSDEVDVEMIHQIALQSSHYTPSEHLPELTISDWQQDYLDGLQKLCLNLLINK